MAIGITEQKQTPISNSNLLWTFWYAAKFWIKGQFQLKIIKKFQDYCISVHLFSITLGLKKIFARDKGKDSFAEIRYLENKTPVDLKRLKYWQIDNGKPNQSL